MGEIHEINQKDEIKEERDGGRDVRQLKKSCEMGEEKRRKRENSETTEKEL